MAIIPALISVVAAWIAAGLACFCASGNPRHGKPVGTGGERMAMAITMYGIRNCDTIKKARTWLEDRGVGYAFHDYKASGIDEARLRGWCEELGWDAILNRTGTTFRKLPDADREGLGVEKAVALMLAQPSMIKRPLLDLGDRRIVGFKPDTYATAFAPAP